MQTNTVKKHKKRKKLSFPQQNWMKLSESLSFDVYNMHAKAGKWVFRAPEFILKRGVLSPRQLSSAFARRPFCTTIFYVDWFNMMKWRIFICKGPICMLYGFAIMNGKI